MQGGRELEVSMSTGNVFESIPDRLDDELIEMLVKNDSIKIERIISKGQSSPENFWYDQQQHEWVIVLKGEGILLFEDGRTETLTVGSHINIPAHTRHRVDWTHPTTETIWLAVYY